MDVVEKLTFGNVHGMPGEASTLPDKTALLGKERRNLAAHKLI